MLKNFVELVAFKVLAFDVLRLRDSSMSGASNKAYCFFFK